MPISPAIRCPVGLRGPKTYAIGPQRLSSFVNPIDLSVCPRLQSGPGSGGATDQPVSLRSGRSPRAVNLPRSLFRETKQPLRSHLKTPREYKFPRAVGACRISFSPDKLLKELRALSPALRNGCALDSSPLSISALFAPWGINALDFAVGSAPLAIVPLGINCMYHSVLTRGDPQLTEASYVAACKLRLGCLGFSARDSPFLTKPESIRNRQVTGSGPSAPARQPSCSVR